MGCQQRPGDRAARVCQVIVRYAWSRGAVADALENRPRCGVLGSSRNELQRRKEERRTQALP